MPPPIQPDISPISSVFFVGTAPEERKQLESFLSPHFPNLAFTGSALAIKSAQEIIQDRRPDIIFFDLQLWKDFRFTPSHYCHRFNYETIILSNSGIELIETIQNAITGYLIKPIKEETLIPLVQHALQRIQEKQEMQQNRHFIQKIIQKRLQEVPIGIPTIEGYEFLEVKDILLCEALRKYTRVVTKDQTDIISSYNLGAFCNLLEPYGFFSPHRSYLINLQHIKKYHREGTLYMADGTCIPIAKRMKKVFLDLIRCL